MCAPEKIYGAPDLIALSTWIEQNFPNALPPAEVNAGATGQRNGHYIALDVKIKTKIDENGNKKDLEMVTAQLSMYSYMLGHLQGYMPQSAFVICRDRVTSPFRIELTSALNSPLDQSLASIRDHWRDIRLNGNRYLPWKDDVVEVNLSADNEKWDSSKKVIAADKTPGGDVTQVLKISLKHKKTLTTLGFPSLNSLLAVDLPSFRSISAKESATAKRRSSSEQFLTRTGPGNPSFLQSRLSRPRRSLSSLLIMSFFRT